jgi:hypothetical protein
MDSIVVFNAERVPHTKDMRNTHTEKGGNVLSPLSNSSDYLWLCLYPANEPIKPSNTSAENTFT